MMDAAIVGLGWWGKTLVESVQGKSSHIRFVKAVTTDCGAAAKFASTHGLVVSPDFNDVLSDPSVEAVVLATPHSLHVDQIIAAAAAGKSVFSEKPLALRLADATRAVDACRDANVVLGLGTDKRFLPGVIELKRLVDDGELGRVIHLEGQYSNDNSSKGLAGAWRNQVAEAPGGGMTGPGLHVLDGLVNLAGPIRLVDARLFEFKGPPQPVDSVAILAEFTNGATGVVGCVRAVPTFFRLHVFGTHGWAELRGFDKLTVSLVDRAPKHLAFDPSLVVGRLLEDFAKSVEGGNPFPVSTVSMLDTVAAFEATITSLERREAVAVQPLP